MSAESSDHAADALAAATGAGSSGRGSRTRRPRADGQGSRTGSTRGDAAPRRRPVVISSVTGKPIAWEDTDDPDHGRRPDAHDAEILRDVPPHWGTGA